MFMKVERVYPSRHASLDNQQVDQISAVWNMLYAITQFKKDITFCIGNKLALLHGGDSFLCNICST
jgi:hypothetical protein